MTIPQDGDERADIVCSWIKENSLQANVSLEEGLSLLARFESWWTGPEDRGASKAAAVAVGYPAAAQTEQRSIDEDRADLQKIRGALDLDDWCGDERMIDVVDRVLLRRAT
jgi:hypothetical protein